MKTEDGGQKVGGEKVRRSEGEKLVISYWLLIIGLRRMNSI